MPRYYEQLSDRVRVVLGQNPGIMTGPGTNTYVVGTGEPILIDTGAGLSVYEENLKAALDEAGLPPPRTVLITHSHPDHFGGAESIRRISPEAEFHKFARPAGGEPFDADFSPLEDGRIFETDGATLQTIHTPGHANDHAVFHLREEGAIFTGDLILGMGTVIIPLEGGDMTHYLASLERLLGHEPERIYPGHGPVIEEGRAKVEEYLAHRRMREEQVLDALRQGLEEPRKIVERIYVDLPAVLHPAAEQSVTMHIRKLIEEGRAIERSEGRFAPASA